MPLPPRFYLPTLSEGQCTLDGSEAHHLLHVRRAKVGDHVELFDGQGRYAAAELTGTGRSEVTLVASSIQVEDVPNLDVTIASPFPKPDRARWMIEKLTELGVVAFVPLITNRSVSSGKSIKTDKMSQYVIDACKQSRRNTLMQIAEPVALADFVPSGSLIVADQKGERFSASPGLPATVVIGPEGGLDDEELHLLSELGAERITFARHILRVETAAIAAAVCLGQEPA